VGSSKYSIEEKEKLYNEYRRGKHVEQIARDFNVPRSTLFLIKKQDEWDRRKLEDQKTGVSSGSKLCDKPGIQEKDEIEYQLYKRSSNIALKLLEVIESEVAEGNLPNPNQVKQLVDTVRELNKLKVLRSSEPSLEGKSKGKDKHDILALTHCRLRLSRYFNGDWSFDTNKEMTKAWFNGGKDIEPFLDRLKEMFEEKYRLNPAKNSPKNV